MGKCNRNRFEILISEVDTFPPQLLFDDLAKMFGTVKNEQNIAEGV